MFSLNSHPLNIQPSHRPDWSRLVTNLHSLHARTLPGVYLNLSLPSIPTPPSSPEIDDNNGEEEHQACSPQYNNVRRGNKPIVLTRTSSH